MQPNLASEIRAVAAVAPERWRMPAYYRLVLACAALVLYLPFADGIEYMVGVWSESGEYNHGFLIPLLSLFLIWQRRNRLRVTSFVGSWYGPILVLLGALFYLVGELATVYTLVQYAFLVVLAGAVLSLVGRPAFPLLAMPLGMLLFMVPLPNFLYNNLSAELQLLSSQLGVRFIQLFNISVFLQGNVIDLGSMKLQVVEACSGLRYLFPLLTFGFIAAYLFKTALWKRVVVFVSTIPITIVMNSLRIGLIGVTVDSWGKKAAEGILHDFEGWVVFMACAALLLLEMRLLTAMGKDAAPLREVFGLEIPTAERAVATSVRRLPEPFLVSSGLLCALLIVSIYMPSREEVVPEHENFAIFPADLAEWHGESDRLDKIYVDALKFDDYILNNYTRADTNAVNLYVAYYGSQRKGQSAHSPRSCIPGDGWEIASHRRIKVPLVDGPTGGLPVNRMVIGKGETRQLVYYWFQERGRLLTNEYMVKWFLLWDALLRGRTDGALVRLTMPVSDGQSVDEVEPVLASFTGEVFSRLERFIPR